MMLVRPNVRRFLKCGLVGLAGSLSISMVSAQEVVCGVGDTVTKPLIHKTAKRSNAKRIITPVAKIYPAVVVKSQGRVLLVARDGKSVEQPLYEGSELRLNDVIQTAATSFVSIRLGDGSISMLPSNSRVQLSQASAGVARYILDSGEVQSKVTRQPKANSSTFEVQTPGSMIGVRGTDFSVRYLSGAPAFSTEVETGKVWVRSRTSCAAPLVLNAGYGALLTDNPRAAAILSAPNMVNPDLAQPDRKLRFEMQPLAGAVKYRVQIVRDPELLETVAEQYSNQPVLLLDAADVPNGYYYAKLTAFDAMGIQSRSQMYVFLRNRVE